MVHLKKKSIFIHLSEIMAWSGTTQVSPNFGKCSIICSVVQPLLSHMPWMYDVGKTMDAKARFMRKGLNYEKIDMEAQNACVLWGFKGQV